MRHSVWGNARPVPNRMLEKQPQDQSLPVLYIQVLPVELCSPLMVGLIVGLLLFLFLFIRVFITKTDATQTFFWVYGRRGCTRTRKLTCSMILFMLCVISHICFHIDGMHFAYCKFFCPDIFGFSHSLCSGSLEMGRKRCGISLLL